MPPAEATSHVSLDNPKLAAAALAAGGRLVEAKPATNGRLAFIVSGVPADFQARVMLADEITVSARAFVLAMDHVLGLIAAHQQRGRF